MQEQNLSSLQVQVNELWDALTHVINKNLIVQIEKEKMEVVLQKKVESLKLDIIRLCGVMEKMKNT